MKNNRIASTGRSTSLAVSAIYLVFFVSGFVALIYESVWSYYLKLFLGHSAYGQVATLAIFLGGIGVGSFLTGRWVGRIKNPLLVYAGVEVLIGLGGLTFHSMYSSATGYCFENFMGNDPGGGLSGTVVQIIVSILLTGPMAILLGATFPLLASTLMRWTTDSGSRSLPGLYFANSMGGAIGIVTCSYFLLRHLGTPGTLQFAGFGNLGIALFTMILAKQVSLGKESGISSAKEEIGERENGETDSNARKIVPLLLFCAFFTSVASFLYEIGWIRLISLIFGSSTHSFEVAISAFIFGLAFGGLFARRFTGKGWRSTIPVLALVQISMGGLAMVTIFLYKPLMAIVTNSHQIFAPTDAAYPWYSVGKYFLVLAMMFPATFCAGLTLPLITYALVERTRKEKFTGYVYGFNTLGAIVGAIAGGLVVLPWLQLKNTIALGAALDILLGLLLVFFAGWTGLKRGVVVVAAAVIIFAGIKYRFDGNLITQGVFRVGNTFDPAKNWSSQVRDGRTATISLHRTREAISIRTNGKSDGSVLLPNFRIEGANDAITMGGVAFLPMLRQNKPYSVALIGLGTGMTAQHLLADPLLKELVIIEIEQEVVNLCRGFSPYNDRVYTDERVRFVVDDAKRFFHRAGKKYDLIISEPSNPWVSGVASLFSREFYHHARHFLTDHGMLVQWVQLYEFNDTMLLSIIGAMGEEFKDRKLYHLENSNDAILLASQHPISPPNPGRLASITSVQEDFRANEWDAATFSDRHQLVTAPMLERLVMISGVPSNSDFFPLVDQNAERSFFKNERADLLAMFKADQFAHYRRLYQSEDSYAEWLENFRLPKPPGRNDFPAADQLFALLTAAPKPESTPDWKVRENLFYESLKPFFHCGWWNELEPVRLFRKQLEEEGEAVPLHTRMRFRLVNGVQNSDRDAIEAGVRHFLEEDDPTMLHPEWARFLLVATGRYLLLEDLFLLKLKYINNNPYLSRLEKQFITDLMVRNLKPQSEGN